jgi:hypothetical protein
MTGSVLSPLLDRLRTGLAGLRTSRGRIASEIRLPPGLDLAAIPRVAQQAGDLRAYLHALGTLERETGCTVIALMRPCRQTARPANGSLGASQGGAKVVPLRRSA